MKEHLSATAAVDNGTEIEIRSLAHHVENDSGKLLVMRPRASWYAFGKRVENVVSLPALACAEGYVGIGFGVPTYRVDHVRKLFVCATVGVIRSVEIEADPLRESVCVPSGRTERVRVGE